MTDGSGAVASSVSSSMERHCAYVAPSSVTSACPMYSSVHAILDARAPNESSYTTTRVSSPIPSEPAILATLPGPSSSKRSASGRFTAVGMWERL